jgi:hypothetical protein
MDFRSLATLAAIAALIFGLGLLVSPAQTAAIYGAGASDAWHLLSARYFGSALLMYGAALWGLRELTEPDAQRRAAGVLAVATAFGLIVTLYAVVGGVMNAAGWSSVALYGFFVVAWARLALARSLSGVA